ncbi:hypothetical protein DF152_17240 [Burkholderia cenocepacia]|nr:hypothetical protein DF152_17240 [Burkholderia cenocepacia]
MSVVFKRYDLHSPETGCAYEEVDADPLSEGYWVKAQDAYDKCAVLSAEIATLKTQLRDVRANAGRYEKLRRWMSSNVAEGWREVENLAAIACYVDWSAFDAALDGLPVCNVGLCERAVKST